MLNVSEIAPDLYRISVFVKDFNLQFNHFLIKDDEPMLYHAGMRQMFPLIKEAVSKLINPKDLNWIGFSHFEVDECGALNEWLQIAPEARPVCSEAGAIVNMSDFSIKPAFAMNEKDKLETGKHSYKFIRTPHLPHGWDAGVLFEESSRTLLCSDLLHQNGDQIDISDGDILEKHKSSMIEYEQGPLMEYSPYSSKTKYYLTKLAELKPETLATMHGSSFNGDCARVLMELDPVMKELWSDNVDQTMNVMQ